MITDYFDESMVLLKDELCWDTEDISYLKSNSRKRDQESVRQWLGPEYSQKLLDWNKADWKLYQHFNQTFNKKVMIFFSYSFPDQEEETRDRYLQKV